MRKIILSFSLGLFSLGAYADVSDLFTADRDGGGQAQLQGQQVHAQDQSIARLQQRCQAFAAHDQIKQFQIKVNFKGYFADYKPQNLCALLANTGGFNLGISMKSNRFQSQTYKGQLAQGQLQVPCTVIKGRKIQVKQDSPQLSIQLDSCDQLNKEHIEKLLITKIKESYQNDPEMYQVDDWQPVIPEACKSLEKVAEKIVEGTCGG